MNKLEQYHFNTQNITFSQIHNTYKDALISMVKDNSVSSYIKYPVQKNEKINIQYLKNFSDIFIGIYSNHDCEFKITVENLGIYQEGSILKNKLRYINYIPIVSLIRNENNIEIETTSDSYLITSIIHVELRKFFATESFTLENFNFRNGTIDNKYYKTLFILPTYEKYGIKDKIDSIDENNDFKEKHGLNLTEKEKKQIMFDFDLFDYYLNKKIKIENKKY